MNEIAYLIILLILSGLFSGSETALIALSLGRAEGLAKEGRNGAQALLRLKKEPTRMLITILIGNNLVNIAAASLAWEKAYNAGNGTEVAALYSADAALLPPGGAQVAGR